MFYQREGVYTSPSPTDCQTKQFEFGNLAAPNLQSTPRKSGTSQFPSYGAKSIDSESVGEILVFHLEI